MASDISPHCGKMWQQCPIANQASEAGGNFCPECGLALNTVAHTEETRSKPASTKRKRSKATSKTQPNRTLTTEEEERLKARKKKAAAEFEVTKAEIPSLKAKGRKKSTKETPASDADTAIIMEALPPDAQRPRTRKRSSKPTKPSTRAPKTKQPAGDAKKRLSAEQLDDIASEVKNEVHKEKANRGKRHGTRTDVASSEPERTKSTVKTVTPESTPSKKRPKKRPTKDSEEHGDFSETQWFVVGVETDADLLEAVDQETYDRDESISEEKRNEFTLREDED